MRWHYQITHMLISEAQNTNIKTINSIRIEINLHVAGIQIYPMSIQKTACIVLPSVGML